MEMKPQNARQMELFSSAVSLSDMEIFIFPELMYALVLANIMSPEIWKWREEDWFRDIEKKSLSYRTNRVKQYIMDHYVFNLDLETWGLTTKEREMARFRDFISPEALAQSNALFGYEGDKYYYDVDIRRHFGLDKYTTEVIPYWKTETVEAMNAFTFKEGYKGGAGECVSLSALYVAALFIVGRMPLDNMFMIGTPLHSQNFLAEKDGLLTNNRRLVTKKMWYNGTELSAKARRSIENERITIVSHLSGVMHTFYKEASIDPERYAFFERKFKEFLHADLSFEYFVNFLYSREKYWGGFQYRHMRNGKECYIPLSCIFNTQRNSKNRFDNESRPALIDEMDSTCFSLSPHPDKILINTLEEDLAEGKTDRVFACGFSDGLRAFLHTEPRLPKVEEKTFIPGTGLQFSPQQSREEIIAYLQEKARGGNALAILSFYARRDMAQTDWTPFIKAAVERNPVCRLACKDMSLPQIEAVLKAMPDESIYPEAERLAQPDEVWNFGRGDGLEKAFLFWNLIRGRFADARADLYVGEGKVKLVCRTPDAREIHCFEARSAKKLNARFSL